MATATLDNQRFLTLDGLRSQRRAICEIARRNKARNIRVIGSVARGEASDSSDLDLLVNLEDDASLLDLVGFRLETEDLLGVRVDVGQEEGLEADVLQSVLEDAVDL